MEIVNIVLYVAGGFVGKYVLDWVVGKFKKTEVSQPKFELIQGETLQPIRSNEDKHFEFYQEMLIKLLHDKLNNPPPENKA